MTDLSMNFICGNLELRGFPDGRAQIIRNSDDGRVKEVIIFWYPIAGGYEIKFVDDKYQEELSLHINILVEIGWEFLNFYKRLHGE